MPTKTRKREQLYEAQKGVARPFVFTVSTVDDLRHLPAPRLAPASVKVEITLPGIPEVQLKQFELRLEHELAACGCREGSLAVLIYLALVSLLAIFGPLAPKSVLAWIAMIGGVLVASILGKIWGLVLAQARLRRVVADLESRFAEGRMG